MPWTIFTKFHTKHYFTIVQTSTEFELDNLKFAKVKQFRAVCQEFKISENECDFCQI